MKKSIKAIIAATFTAALLAGCSSNTASTTTAAETTTATATEAAAETTTSESADAADTALADGSYTIGINQFAVHGSLDNCREGFLEGLAENGIVEGKNLTVLEENAQADPERPECIQRRQKERHPGHLYSRYGSGCSRARKR